MGFGWAHWTDQLCADLPWCHSSLMSRERNRGEEIDRGVFGLYLTDGKSLYRGIELVGKDVD